MVLTVDNVIREWLQGVAEEGHTKSGSLSFKRNTSTGISILYSYAVALACTPSYQKNFFLVNTTRYSQTTSKHRNKVLRLLSKTRRSYIETQEEEIQRV